MRDTNGNQPSGLRKRVRMDCAFGHLTVGPPHNARRPGHEPRGDRDELVPCATMEHDVLQEARFADVARRASMPPEPVVTVRRRVRTIAAIP